MLTCVAFGSYTPSPRHLVLICKEEIISVAAIWEVISLYTHHHISHKVRILYMVVDGTDGGDGDLDDYIYILITVPAAGSGCRNRWYTLLSDLQYWKPTERNISSSGNTGSQVQALRKGSVSCNSLGCNYQTKTTWVFGKGFREGLWVYLCLWLLMFTSGFMKYSL